jgi:hypothetical protein
MPYQLHKHDGCYPPRPTITKGPPQIKGRNVLYPPAVRSVNYHLGFPAVPNRRNGKGDRAVSGGKIRRLARILSESVVPNTQAVARAEIMDRPLSV